MASAATHAVLPLVATAPGRRLQVDAGLRSHRRRFGEPSGFWLPECAYEPGLERLLAERGIDFFCTDQSAHEAPLEALAPVATPRGPGGAHDRLGGGRAGSGRWTAIPPTAPTPTLPRSPAARHPHPGRSTAPPTTPSAPATRAREQAAEFVAAIAARLERFRAERGRPGLVTFAIDTELLGHWWWEGPDWLAEVIRLAPGAGVELVTADRRRSSATSRPSAPLRRSSWGEGKDLRTWDSPAVADLAWARTAARAAAAAGPRRRPWAPTRPSARPASCSRVQASDWAFLDGRGDRPATTPTSAPPATPRRCSRPYTPRRPPDPRLRNLAPGPQPRPAPRALGTPP